MGFKKVVVVGGGVLGSQIAYQVAYKGFDVTVWLRSEGSIGRAKPKFERWHETYKKDLEATKVLIGTDTKLYPRGLVDDFASLTPEKIDALKEQADKAYEGLIYELDMAKAMADADLVIESLSEDPKAKIEFYQAMAPLLPEKTVVVTNSSTMLPSTFASYTGRPEKYLALHFANEIWKNNTAEIMGHPGTAQKYYDEVVAFAKEIFSAGSVPECRTGLICKRRNRSANYRSDLDAWNWSTTWTVPYSGYCRTGYRLQYRNDESRGKESRDITGQDCHSSERIYRCR